MNDYDTAPPMPSAFRTLWLKPYQPAGLFAARLIHDKVDFNYSLLDGNHQFVYPVQHHKTVMAIVREFDDERQKRQTPEQTAEKKAEMARTIRDAYRDSWV